MKPAGALEFDAIYRDHHAVLYAYILRRVGGRADLAADLTHDAFLRAARWAETHVWVERGRPVLALLTTVAKSVVSDWWRRGPGKHETPVAYPSPDAAPLWVTVPDPETAGIGAEQRRRWRVVLQAALADLQPRQRQVVMLSVVHGMTQREIAAELGITEGTVKVHKYRAMVALRSDPRIRELSHDH